MTTNNLSTASTVAMQTDDDDQGQMPRSNASNVSAIYARLPFPEMCYTNVEAWFVSMEFWFSASGITSDKQKAATVLAALKPVEVITSMPASDRFEYIKRKIIDHLADSEQRRLNRLLSEMPLGDKKPSELFFEMKRVAGNSIGETALKGLWIKRLPTFAQPVVAASNGAATEFTKIADSIVDAVSPSQVCKVSKDHASDISELRTAIMDLSRKFQQFTIRSRSRSRTHNTARHRSQHRQASPDGETSNLDECWYHKKYGRNARRCRSPCKHKQRQAHAVTAHPSD
ncbi:uncharacterized protein LOC133333600 [Musca vetustissima]|uniref:uncharacterized protein LOC133333600 n=1 Tax=Musca vetustissima TaxID=27455 RepID=UPI002AB70B8D|nr:uncharacterized protein LOC133333600 [Musca vetustissima]